MIFYLVLEVIISIYLILSAKRDLKERKVYSSLSLGFAWIIVLSTVTDGVFELKTVFVFSIIHMIIFILMNYFHIWGAGDSDVFLLFASIILNTYSILGSKGMIKIIYTSQFHLVMEVILIECLSLAFALSLSVLISKIESKVKRTKLTLKSGIAVIPGLAIVMIGFMMAGVYGRWKF